MGKVSEPQRRAVERWNAKNKEKSNFMKQRSSARSFIRKKASGEDLDELEGIISERRRELEDF
ncbi:hypothetical protein LQU94_04125 [Peptoniphilus sp. KCTC 25270]|uniref:hypothetical protein n=1 Tax=Peptoniphilus sp. KCTC 25270 TaxID=2897414 RepID=UPI001E54D0D1|nr:hypothetical protein [Peptoniphilus sp. KCTC 25270]MCD1147293.1 hypothetical protein [Peptoniphilus sp. KCTC 25270]